MSINKNKNLDENKNLSENNEISSKKYLATKTIKVTCNGVFDLIEGEEIPKEINKNFITSLVSSKLIKQK